MRLLLASQWRTWGYNVEFVLLRAEGELVPDVPSDIPIVDLGVEHFRAALLPLVKYLRTNEPAVLLAAMWPLTVIAAAARVLAQTDTRVVVSEHGVLSLGYASKGNLHRLALRATMALGYRLAHERIGVSRGVVSDLAYLARMPETAFRVVHNPAARGEQIDTSKHANELSGVEGPVILSVGTLKAVKNHRLLIDAFARLDPSLGATLCILGDGEMRSELVTLAQTLGVAGKVRLPGFRADPRPFYARASVFVLSSDHEGFGNVLVEALEAGVQVVSTDCPFGPREILADGKYGRLVPCGDASALAIALQEALHAPAERELLTARARDFLLPSVAREYLKIMLPGRSRSTCSETR
jgi:glycosyltransferase involved in cell wall biosynthesis